MKQTQNPLPKVSSFSVNLDTMSGVIQNYIQCKALNYEFAAEEEDEEEEQHDYDSFNKTIDLRELLGPDLALQENVIVFYNVPLKTGSNFLFNVTSYYWYFF